MKKIILGLMLLGLLQISCDEPTPHIIFPPEDTTANNNNVYKSDNSGGSIPGLDAEVIDYTLPNEYQNKSQLFRDSTIVMSWSSAGFKNAKHFIRFFEQFQWDVMDRNKEKIAARIQFPLRDYKTKAEFYRHFDSIFAPTFVEQVLHQNPSEIFRNKKGAMLGNDGQIWMKPKGSTYVIFEVNP
jgi:hypothetical protein